MGIAAKTGGELSSCQASVPVFCILLGALLALAIAGCGDPDAASRRSGPAPPATAASATPRPGLGGRNQEEGSLFGPGGLFGSKADRTRRTIGGTGVAVNAFLWRASLDTINFIPLVSADPFGGVIITDWYTPAETPNERMKVQVTILDRELRADGVRVSVFKQQPDAQGRRLGRCPGRPAHQHRHRERHPDPGPPASDRLGKLGAGALTPHLQRLT